MKKIYKNRKKVDLQVEKKNCHFNYGNSENILIDVLESGRRKKSVT